MNEECLICKVPLKYTENGVFMECAICHKKEETKTFCENGHYASNECYSKGPDQIISVSMNETVKNSIKQSVFRSKMSFQQKTDRSLNFYIIIQLKY